MKKGLSSALAACFAAALLSCGGSNEGDQTNVRKPFGDRASSSGLPTFTGSSVTGLIGIVVDSTSGNPIAGVAVAAGALTTTTDANGNFAIPTIPNGTSIVSFNIASHAQQSRTVVVTSGIETSVIMLMTPNAATTPATFDPATGDTINLGTTSQLIATAGALAQADGSAPAAGAATVTVTPLATSLDPYVIPGEYVAGGAPFETFGGVDIRVDDSAGNALTNVVGTVTIRIPVSSRAGVRPASLSLLRFDPASGTYVADGTATLGGASPNFYYEGTITRIGTWVAGQAYTPSTISVCVENQNGVRIPGARVQSDGISYSGGSAAVTDPSGVALVPMKRGGQAVFTATSPRSSSSGSVSAAQSASDFTLTPCLVMPTSGLTIRLTWGSSPSDLDSHLKGPNNTHVFFAGSGSLASQPFAKLDVDDVTSFGPEVITVARLGMGTYEYFVHNFSGTFAPGITGSPARIEMRYGSQIRIFAPPAGEGGVNEYWRVFQFSVAGDCSVTFTPVQQWSLGEPANPAPATVNYCP
jgi:hypothetical protein